jgi:excisionase family DNA binding protein
VDKPLLKVQETAARLGIKPATVRAWLLRRRLPCVHVGRAVRIPADAIAQFIDNKELQVLRQVLKRYKLWANLQGDVKFERELDHIGKAMPDEDETRLLAACEWNALLRTVVTLALNTALRKNEIRPAVASDRLA